MKSKRLGIMGGGQLARMLAQAALSLGQTPVCLAQSPDDPAAQLCPDSIFGNPQDPQTVKKLFQNSDLIAFENEFVNCDILDQVSSQTPTPVLPDTNVIRLLQDKLGQKSLLKKLSIPTANYAVIDVPKWIRHPQESWQELFNLFPDGAVLKWAKLGYDGKGTFFVTPDKTPDQRLENFLQEALAKKVEVFAEEKIDYIRELAVIGCFSTRKEFRAYPLVISEQSGGICHWTFGPAKHLGVDEKLENLAHDYAEKIARDLNLFGAFGVEFFETKDGKLLINELAPRVHNTGHYTMDAPCTSQFENHWRALLGMPLGSTEIEDRILIMRNLLGEMPNLNQMSPHMHLHWYGKKELITARKMGHINVIIKGSNSIANSQLDELKREINSVIEDKSNA